MYSTPTFTWARLQLPSKFIFVLYMPLRGRAMILGRGAAGKSFGCASKARLPTLKPLAGIKNRANNHHNVK
eukprot:4476952-Pleurochrysis_carterae.AAC.1